MAENALRQTVASDIGNQIHGEGEGIPAQIVFTKECTKCKMWWYNYTILYSKYYAIYEIETERSRKCWMVWGRVESHEYGLRPFYLLAATGLKSFWDIKYIGI